MKDVAASPAFVPEMPLHMVWLATNLCNARCRHCSSNSGRRAPGELTTAEACEVVRELASDGTIDLAISGGEPLLREDLFEVISEARSRGLRVGVGTNGALLSAAQVRRLVGGGVCRLQVSLDGLAPSHDQLRCWDGLFERAVAAIRLAVEHGLRTHVCCTISRVNVDELEQLVQFAIGLRVSRLNFSRYVPTGRGDRNLDLPDEAWSGVITTCQDLKRRYRGRIEIVTHLAQQVLIDEDVADMPAFIGCQAGIGQGCITADGTVLPCVMLPIPLGNLRQQSFRVIWTQSKVNLDLRSRAALRGRCGACEQRARCGGCRALAFARTGDYLASDPRCWIRVPGTIDESMPVQ